MPWIDDKNATPQSSSQSPDLTSSAEKLAVLYLNEKRKSRQWGGALKLITLFYVGVFLLSFSSFRLIDFPFSGKNIAAIVRIDGPIISGGLTNATDTNNALTEAFENRSTAGIILEINSPGGSPVQAGRIYDHIISLKEKHNLPLYAVVGDICASGGYYIASAADEIYADKASLIGSIGVRMDSFGFTDVLSKTGIERRSFIAGENKGFLDPFFPLRAEHAEHAQLLIDEIHEQFISAVKKGRGEKLQLEKVKLFSGLVWTGAKSVELGLVDGLGTILSVSETSIGVVDTRDFTRTDESMGSWVRRLSTTFNDFAIFFNRML
jgi:protease-4